MFANKLAVTLIFLLIFASCSSAYITRIHIPAVIESAQKGSLTMAQLNLTPGSGGVQINGPSSVDPTTLTSAQYAAQVAASFVGLSASNYNFNYTIFAGNTSVSGPSGGLALTLLAVAALQHRQLAQNFTATGTISPNGTVGLIGGVYDKMGAAKAGGMRYILVPAAQNQSFENLLYYISQQSSSLVAIEVANVSQAVKYAFGSPHLTPTAINLSQNYNIPAAGTANITCKSCNTSAFAELVNATFNYTRGAIQNTSSNFSSAKQQLLSNLNAYKQLESKGYLYTAADFAFLDYVGTYTLSNSKNFTASSASALISNVSAYCSSLVAPPLTNTNYEFVIGGKLRERFANITITNVKQELNSVQTTDDVIQSIYSLASAAGWCKAANEAFSIASSLGGNYVDVSPSLKTNAASLISKAKNLGNGIYLQTATQAYNSGDYPTALYAATYANIFGPAASANISTPQMYAVVVQNINNDTSGIWPSQFAIQSEFYLRESQASHGSVSRNYALQSYSAALLASGIESADSAINSAFTITNISSSSGFMQQITGIQQSISSIYTILLLNAILLFVVLVVLLVHLLSHKKEQKAQEAHGNRRKR